MADISLKYQIFEQYLTRAQQFEKSDHLVLAKKFYFLAGKEMLEISKLSTGAQQKAQLERAKNIINRADSLGNNKPEPTVEPIEVKEEPVEKVTLEEALNKLNSLIGLATVKKQIAAWVDQIKVFQIRKERGMKVPPMSYHLVFTGNPGSGKTTVARIISQIFCALGILSKGHLVEVDRDDLVAGFVGQTAIKTSEIIRKAYGGVLFIDEAYGLAREQGNDFGREAIDTLLKEMEDHRDDFAVIVAGYSEPMNDFLSSNPGLESRFKTHIHFEDYNPDELYKIFAKFISDSEYLVSENVKVCLYEYFNKIYANRGEKFGNGRDVRNLFENIITEQSQRVADLNHPSNEELAIINVDDLPDYVKGILKPKSVITEDQIQASNLDEKNVAPTENNTFVKDEKSDLPDEESQNGTVFTWSDIPTISFDDVVGLDKAKKEVEAKVLMPIKHPESFEGYDKQNGGGLFLYGPPGTGKTMIAAAIAHEINARFCHVKPSDLIFPKPGETERMIQTLFNEAKSFKCAIIYFDEMDSIASKNTRATITKQMRSELLSCMQGMDSYLEKDDHILFLIGATNKPWEVDSAFIRPGRLGTRVYVGLPEYDSRVKIIENKLSSISKRGLVTICEDIDLHKIGQNTEGFNCADVNNLLNKVQEISALRDVEEHQKYICHQDFVEALKDIHSTVQQSDLKRIKDWEDTEFIR